MTDPLVAEAVEKLHRGLGDPEKPRRRWDLAVYPRSGTTHLFVDGAGSNGDRRHLAARHLVRLHKLEPDYHPRVRAHSYYAKRGRRSYIGRDTLGALEGHVQHLTNVLSARSLYGRWVITAYSLGAAVTVHALRRLCDEGGDLSARVPQLTLLAPALQGAPRVFAHLKTGESAFGPDIPRIATDLGPPDSPNQLASQAAIPVLLDAGVAVAIISSQYDEFAPYRPLPDPRIQHFEMAEVEPNERTEIDVHFAARESAANHAIIAQLAKPLVSIE